MTEYYALLYDKGRRSKNEDSIAVHKIRLSGGEAVMGLVCDGMGGMDRGEVASGYAAEQLSTWFYDELPVLLKGRSFPKRKLLLSVTAKVQEMHETLRCYGRKNELRMGTTMTLLLLYGGHYLVFQTGDSMAYQIRRKGKKLTCQEGDGNRLTHCVGFGKFEPPLYNSGRIRRGTVFLLVSDGLTRRLREKDLYEALSTRRIHGKAETEKVLKRLCITASGRGETDNMSAVCLYCG